MNSECPTRVSEISPAAVREQLVRMLAHPVFKASRRCQILLQYLVEYALRGEKFHPKERTLGQEVFGRAPDYDTNDDPVVRTTASDIRKRIAQYYHELQHGTELRIDLPQGSYLPKFHLSNSQLMETPAEEKVAQAPFVSSAPLARKTISRTHVGTAAMAILALSVLAFFWLRTPSPLERFWSPILGQSQSLSVCLPVSSSKNIPNSRPAALETLGMPSVGLTDQMALLQITHFLDSRKARFNVKLLSFAFPVASTPSEAPLVPSLAELRTGPVIFIGNSDWSMRLATPLRFHAHEDDASDLFWIEDKQNPSLKAWSGKIDQTYDGYTNDYAVISRVFDSTTGQTIVVVSGLGLHGTAAAAELITDPNSMSQVAAGFSPEWQKKNLQIVISTKIAGNSWGPPQILAKYFW